MGNKVCMTVCMLPGDVVEGLVGPGTKTVAWDCGLVRGRWLWTTMVLIGAVMDVIRLKNGRVGSGWLVLKNYRSVVSGLGQHSC